MIRLQSISAHIRSIFILAVVAFVLSRSLAFYAREKSVCNVKVESIVVRITKKSIDLVCARVVIDSRARADFAQARVIAHTFVYY